MRQKHKITIALFVVVAIISAVLSFGVKINYDISDYLDEKSQTKQALKIIDKEFGTTGSIQVMISDIDSDEAESVADQLEDIEHVKNVSFDVNETKSYKDNKALYVILADGDDYSDNARSVIADIHNTLDSKYSDIEYGGTAVEKQKLEEKITREVPFILTISIMLVIIILLVTAESWLEPVLLLVSCGIAVIINKGTNIIFDDVSYITNSIAAILQLALSIDYSIILLHTYRRKKDLHDNPASAMDDAIKAVVSPVSASALTTIAGLMALLFMSFKIGFDIGIVMMKGIAISAVTALTLFPALILWFDKPLNKWTKRTFVPTGKAFCNIAFKASGIVIPLALIIIGGSYFLQSNINYVFTDAGDENTVITDAFGDNNTLAVVYPNGSDNNSLENEFVNQAKTLKHSDGSQILQDYTAYSNTAREVYGVKKAAQKLNQSKDDVELLFTMMHLEKSRNRLKLTPGRFIHYADTLIKTDPDVTEFIDKSTRDSIATMVDADSLMSGSYTPSQLYGKLRSGDLAVKGLSKSDIENLYALYLGDRIKVQPVKYTTMLNYIVGNNTVRKALDGETIASLEQLIGGINQFKAMVKANPEMLEDENMAALYKTINSKCSYGKFVATTGYVVMALTGEAPQMSIDAASVKKVYTLYAVDHGAVKRTKVRTSKLVNYIIKESKNNSSIKSAISGKQIKKLKDLRDVYKFMSEGRSYNYIKMVDRMERFKKSLRTVDVSTDLNKDRVLGVYCKYSINNNGGLTEPEEARTLIDYVASRMDTNTVLKDRLSDRDRQKVRDAQEDLQRANELFCGKNYSRMLMTVDLPNDSAETHEYVKDITNTAKSVFGEDTNIAGEIVSTTDLANAFDFDNKLITFLTIAMVFLIVMVVFKSLSIPLLLVTIIQGAIWIAFATGKIMNSPVFFMSFIVTTCVLMGATIDYGILMSSNYVELRSTMDKKEALITSVRRAMPTVFTSGTILAVCGLVISFVSTQLGISCVGQFVGTGAICSMILIAVLLPSVLYLLDGFILKLSIRK